MSSATVDAGVVVAPAAGLRRTFRQLRMHPGNRVQHVCTVFRTNLSKKILCNLNGTYLIVKLENTYIYNQ